MNTTILSTTESPGSDAEEPGSSTSGDVPPEPGSTRRPAEPENRIDLSPGDLSDSAIVRLRDGLQDVIQHLPRVIERVGVRVMNDDEMTGLHARWKDAPSTTDVVTFDLSDSSDGPLRVDIAVCLDEANRQAASRNHQPEDELLLYVVHGLLHCCGHDDTSEAASAAMHAEEDRLLIAIGREPVYSRGEQS
ncbi:MAG: rRNA maturation RNase YbeY [Phycisphaerales bacterium]|nr:rRNA maturation RNase YbeY [Phycisphaerales bacterium]